MGILISHDIRQARTLSGFSPMLQAVVKGTLEDLREVGRMRLSPLDGVSLLDGEIVIARTHQIHVRSLSNKCCQR